MPQVSDEEARAMQHLIVKACQTTTTGGTANERQVGGTHYSQTAKGGRQHWDEAWDEYREAWFVLNIKKYITRYRKKDGIKDLEKARHYLDKLIEKEREDEAKGKEEEEIHSTPESRGKPVESWPRCYFCTQLAPSLVDTVKGPMCERCYSSRVSMGFFKSESGKE